jgi:glycosyltransferase involved in cell wall biosynthesis
VYEYANHLARRGHKVVVLYPRLWPPAPRAAFRRSYWRGLPRALSLDGRPQWMETEASVNGIQLPSLRSKYLPNADVTFATGWQTAQAVSDADNRVGARFQLVQHYETWAGSEPRVNASLRLPLHKVVISRWLLDVVRDLSPDARLSYVPNGLDFETFYCEQTPERRERGGVAMLLHKSRWKGTEDGLLALKIAHDRRPEIRAELFSTMQAPRSLPEWMRFHGRLDGAGLRRLFNEVSMFLHPSLSEGWPLPPAEAMACGCALVATDNPGVLDYADADHTAMVARRGDARSLADALVSLFDDDCRRVSMARRGQVAIASYTWDRAVTALEATIRSSFDEAS